MNSFLTTIGQSDSRRIDEVRYIEEISCRCMQPRRDLIKMAEDSVLLWERNDGLQFKTESGTGENKSAISKTAKRHS